jgi:hypothetical protein
MNGKYFKFNKILEMFYQKKKENRKKRKKKRKKEMFVMTL